MLSISVMLSSMLSSLQSPPEILWTFNTTGWKNLGGPSIDSKENLYWGDDVGFVYKVSKEGKQQWKSYFSCTYPEEERVNGVPITVMNAIPKGFDISNIPYAIWFDMAGETCDRFTSTSSILLNDSMLFIASRQCSKLYWINTIDGSVQRSINVQDLPSTKKDPLQLGGGFTSSPAYSKKTDTIYIPGGDFWGDQWCEGAKLGIDFRNVTKRKVSDSRLYAFTADGEYKWEMVAESPDRRRTAWYPSPAIGPDGTIFVGNFNGYLYSITDLGSTYRINWKYYSKRTSIFFSCGDSDTGLNISTPDYFEWWSSPVLSPEGILYLGSNDFNFYAFNSTTGDVLWTYPTVGEVYQSPVLGSDGTVYITCEGDSGNSTLFALTSKGVLKWKLVHPTIGIDFQIPLITSDGTLVVGFTGTVSEVWGVSIEDGSILWIRDSIGNNPTMSPSISNDGTQLYVLGGADGNFWMSAIKHNSTLADSPCPKFRCDAQNTGRN
eukprot:TRINITY_DN1564_c0_g2_i1.p1 TRINITY_DN1564_c0_g2~~TRINITY_DN1564_c0_g2_i1.p1  ORF type:complete len:513 (+),score=89.48 TRINITY_DN1564_c0_g2_i1:66-1541(+)